MSYVLNFESSVLRHLLLSATESQIEDAFYSVASHHLAVALVAVQELCAPVGAAAISRACKVLGPSQLSALTWMMREATDAGDNWKRNAGESCFLLIEALINSMTGSSSARAH